MTSSDISLKNSSSSMHSYQSGESDMTDAMSDKQKEKTSKFELIDQPSRSILPNWEKLFDDENSLTNGNEIQQEFRRSSKSPTTISAFNTQQDDDISNLIEEAKLTINILPGASHPLTVPDHSSNLLSDENMSSKEDDVQQQCPRSPESSPPASAFDRIRLIEFSGINEHAETNMNILFAAPPSMVFPDQDTGINLPNWDYLFGDENPSSYGEEIEQQCLNSPDWAYNITAVNPIETVDFSDMNEQAKPNINIVPDIPPPSVLPVQSIHSIFPNPKYSSHDYTLDLLQPNLMNTEYSTSFFAFDPMPIIDSSEINEQAKPNIKKIPDAPPPPVLPI